MMTKVKLDKITGNMLKPPAGLSAVLLRFPTDTKHTLCNGHHAAKTMFVHLHNQTADGGPMLSVGMDYGEADPLAQGMPLFSIRNLPLNHLPLLDTENELEAHPSLMIGEPLDTVLMKQALRLAVMLCPPNNGRES